MSSAGAGYATRDRFLAPQFVRAASEARVGRIIYLGGLGEPGAGLSEHLSSHREVERLLGFTGVPVTTPETVGGVFGIGGSEVLCYRDIMRVMAEELGLRQRWVIPVPLLTPGLSSYWIHLVTPLSHNTAKPLAEGLKNPVVCREKRITRLIPQEFLSVQESIQAGLYDMCEHCVETNWSMAGAIPCDADWTGGAVLRDVRYTTIDAPA